MRVLHVVKTSDGATWAANQAAVLSRLGVEVHVALPRTEGRTVEAWRHAGATIHVADLSLPVRHPEQIGAMARRVCRLVEEVKPDLIHSHHVTTTLGLRLALGKRHKIPRVFQVAGPLHLEHWYSRRAELMTAGDPDYWIGSSQCINEHYRRAGIPQARVFLSYNGTQMKGAATRGWLRQKLGIPAGALMAGNINYIYPPKYLLGERTGLKGHETVIDALSIVIEKLDNFYGVLVGETFPGRSRLYETRLRERAARVGRNRILMPGYLSPEEVWQSWSDFDCAVHVPLSENCGGVVEPLFAGVPVIAGRVGGLPEVVFDGVTGSLVPVGNPTVLAAAILNVLSDLGRWRKIASNGQQLVRSMFDVNRTGREVVQIYQHIMCGTSRPANFNPAFLDPEPAGLVVS
jgi:glycosyltransferase involved in cell wall biosynthesis